MKKFAVITMLVFVCVCAFAFGGCTKDENVSSEAAVLKVAVLNDINSAPILIADQQGFFDKGKYKVEVILFDSAADRDAALQSGAIDGAISDVLAVAFALNGGFNVKITSRSEGVFKFMASAASGITSLDQMFNRSVALSQNTIIEYYVDQMLTNAGVSIDSVKKEIVKQMPARLEMLRNGQVDTAVLPEPLASAIDDAVCIGNSNDFDIDISILLFTQNSIDEKQAQIEFFYQGYNAGCKYINENTAEAINILISDCGFPEAAKDNLVLPTYREAGMIEQSSFDTCINWMYERKLINKTIEFKDATTDLLY